MTAPLKDLVYFMHTINGREYGGWYRLLAADCIEVLAPGFISVVPLNGKPAEELSCRILEDFVRARLRQGAPVPAVPRAFIEERPSHVCNELHSRDTTSGTSRHTRS